MANTLHRVETYVPTHLRRTYPSVFTLILATFAVVISPGVTFNYIDVANDIWAGIAVAFLFYGWVANKIQHTFTGLWMSAGLWMSITVDFLITPYFSFAGTAQLVLFSVSFFFLSVGAWWLMRIDPYVPVGHPRKKGADA